VLAALIRVHEPRGAAHLSNASSTAKSAPTAAQIFEAKSA